MKTHGNKIALKPITQAVALVGFFILTFSVSSLGSWATLTSVDTWYQTLVRPPLNPPDWIFGPVWATLYALIAISGWLAWRQQGFAAARYAFTLYSLQLGLNLLWSIIFFTLKNPGGAIIIILVLWAVILANMLAFLKIDRHAGFLLVPYLLWVSFATYLNIGIWHLN